MQVVECSHALERARHAGQATVLVNVVLHILREAVAES